MQLIANGTQGPTTVPAKQTPVGTPGYGYGGPPGSTPATDVDPDIFNTMLAELVSLATATGSALDPANNAQAKGAVKTLAGSNATGITTAGATVLTASQAGLVEVNATAGNIIITLPAAPSTGTVFRFEFLRIDATANTVTVAPPSGTIINEPGSSASITLPPSSLTRLICDSGNYIQDGPYVGPSALAAYVTSSALTAELAGYAPLSSWTNSKGDAGWQKGPDGIIEQWGAVTITSSGTATFPIAFPNAAFADSLTATLTGTASGAPSAPMVNPTVSTTQASFYIGAGYTNSINYRIKGR